MKESELRRVSKLARDVLELGEEGLVPGGVSDLARGVLALCDDLAEARSWSRGYEHGDFEVDTEHPPTWLTAPLELDGGALPALAEGAKPAADDTGP